MANKLFIVCDSNTQYDSLCLKSDFEQIREKIKLFIINSNNNGFNKIKIFDNSKEYDVYSDIIYITDF